MAKVFQVFKGLKAIPGTYKTRTQAEKARDKEIEASIPQAVRDIMGDERADGELKQIEGRFTIRQVESDEADEDETQARMNEINAAAARAKLEADKDDNTGKNE